MLSRKSFNSLKSAIIGLATLLGFPGIDYLFITSSSVSAQEAFALTAEAKSFLEAPAEEPQLAPRTFEELVESLTKAESRLAELETEKKELATSQEETAEQVEGILKDLEKEAKAKEKAKKEKKWFENYTVRGYAQFRMNDVIDTEAGSAPAQHVGDSSVGDNQSFLVRRARLIFSGNVSDHVTVYLQPDFAATPNGSVDSIHFVQIRDWYGDLHFDTTKIHRLRVGQSKVPYGWENMQSSSNRLPLDRSDSLNSAVKNERDLGIFYYWTPESAQDLYKWVLDEGLKGSGNYGVFGMGFYNGQGGSFREVNDDVHFVSRLNVPWKMSNGQVMEAGVQGYTGMYSVYGSRISPLGVGPAVLPNGTIDTGNTRGIIDKRIATTFVYYPQPIGFQCEWTVGRGPGLNDSQTAVVDRALYGGYVMSMYRHQTECYGEFFPFIRWNYFKGGYKSERNAPFTEIDELETGLEWQIGKHVELVGMYVLTDRTNTRAVSATDSLSYQQFNGELARFQLQVNY